MNETGFSKSNEKINDLLIDLSFSVSGGEGEEIVLSEINKKLIVMFDRIRQENKNLNIENISFIKEKLKLIGLSKNTNKKIEKNIEKINALLSQFARKISLRNILINNEPLNNSDDMPNMCQFFEGFLKALNARLISLDHLGDFCEVFFEEDYNQKLNSKKVLQFKMDDLEEIKRLFEQILEMNQILAFSLIELLKDIDIIQKEFLYASRIIPNFQPTNRNILISIAMLCARKSPWMTAKKIKEFGIKNEGSLIEIAKLCAENNVEATAIYIKEFGIEDQSSLIEIAKFCVEKDGIATVKNIKKFGIKNEGGLIEIAKLCAIRHPGLTAIYIKNFGIEDQSSLIEIAKLCAEKDGKATAENIKEFGIKNEGSLIEIAKFCAEKDLEGTASNIKEFGIEDQSSLIEIAKFCVEKDGIATVRNIKKFGIKNEGGLIEIAKLCAIRHPGLTAIYIKEFGIEDQSSLIEIAKFCVEKDGIATVRNIKKFGIKNEGGLIEIAKLCAIRHPGLTAIYIKEFGIEDQSSLIEIAKLCAEKDGKATAENIKKFGIKDEGGLIKIAKFCAEKDGKATAENIKKFGIKDEGGLIKIAKFCAEKDLEGTASNIKEFGIEDQSSLIEIAKLCLEIDRIATVKNIKKFGIKNEGGLIEIAKLCAIRHPGLTAIYIKEFGIEDQSSLIEIAKICAEKDGGATAIYIKEFGIEDQSSLIEIAKLCAIRYPGLTAKNIKKFGIKDEGILIEIAKLCAKESGGGTASNIKEFGIEDEGILIEIAKLCAEKDGGATAKNIKEFGIKDEGILIEIAKLCAEKDGGATAKNIKEFGIKDEGILIEIAKLCAEKDGGATAKNIKEFGIKDEGILIEIAKLCAEKDGGATAKNIKEFGIKDEGILIEIAKLCAKENGGETAIKIKEFGIEDQRSLVEIAKLCAEKNVRLTVLNIKEFGVEDEVGLIEIAKLCAQQDGYFFAANVGRFKFSSQEARKQLFLLAIMQNPLSFCAVRNFNIPNEEIFLSLAEIYNLDDFEMNKSILVLKKYVELNCKSLVDESLFEELNKIKDPFAKKQVIKWLGVALVVLIESLGEPSLKWIKDHGFIKQAINFKHPRTRELIILILQSLNKDEQKKIEELDVKIDEKINKKMYEKDSKGIFFKLMLSKLFVYCQDEEEEKKVFSYLKVFKSSTVAKLYQDTKKMGMLIEMLYLLMQETTLDKGSVGLILDKISKYKDLQDIRKSQESLCYILKLGFGSRLKDDTRELTEIFSEVFAEIVPLGKVDDLLTKFTNTFESSRNPKAIFKYASSIKLLNNKSAMECFAGFVTGVLNGTFIEDRNSLNGNFHLTKIFKDKPELHFKWKEAQKTTLTELVSIRDNASEKFCFSIWLDQKIKDKHLDIEPYQNLQNFLNTEDNEKRIKIFNELENSLKEKDDVNAQFEYKCFLLWKVWEDPKKRLEVLNEMDKYIKGSRLSNSEFANDIKSLLESSDSGAIVVDTEDPYDLLLCGTDVNGSCQRVDGDPQLNKGLLGYLCDGKIRLIAVKNKQGKIVARSLLRILWEKNEEKPILFLDRFYPDPTSEVNKNAIRYLAQKKADSLEIQLVESDLYKKFDKALQSFEGPAPFEYVDPKSGVMEKGEYTFSC